MNRLVATADLFPEDTASASVGVDLLDRWTCESHSPAPEGSPPATFSPMHYEAGYAYPLVVWLHGAGQSEHDLPEVMAHVSTRNYVAIAPVAIGSSSDPWPQTTSGIADAEQRVLSAIESATRQFNTHSDRVFLAGVGAGGTAALRLALAYPESFAGAASFDGALPVGHTPFSRLNTLRGLPLLLGTGEDSMRYPSTRCCSDLRLLHTAGCTLTLRHEPGDGDLTTTMLAELDRWMMAIVCGEHATAS